jgi:hypothetical protein
MRKNIAWKGRARAIIDRQATVNISGFSVSSSNPRNRRLPELRPIIAAWIAQALSEEPSSEDLELGTTGALRFLSELKVTPDLHFLLRVSR